MVRKPQPQSVLLLALTAMLVVFALSSCAERPVPTLVPRSSAPTYADPALAVAAESSALSAQQTEVAIQGELGALAVAGTAQAMTVSARSYALQGTATQLALERQLAESAAATATVSREREAAATAEAERNATAAAQVAAMQNATATAVSAEATRVAPITAEAALLAEQRLRLTREAEERQAGNTAMAAGFDTWVPRVFMAALLIAVMVGLAAAIRAGYMWARHRANVSWTPGGIMVLGDPGNPRRVRVIEMERSFGPALNPYAELPAPPPVEVQEHVTQLALARRAAGDIAAAGAEGVEALQALSAASSQPALPPVIRVEPAVATVLREALALTDGREDEEGAVIEGTVVHTG